ncbi:hypothetical protein [Oceanicola sp. S124]|nr:hypothetical protein [Oceanicola sp. S124]
MVSFQPVLVVRIAAAFFRTMAAYVYLAAQAGTRAARGLIGR